jgi:SAM-dependent methyltransferase
MTITTSVAAPKLRTTPAGHFERFLDRCHQRLIAGHDTVGTVHLLLDGLRLTRNGCTLDEWQQRAAAARAHPLSERMLRCPLTRSAAQRPRGDPGDAVLLDYIYRHHSVAEEVLGAPRAARELHGALLERPAAEALRDRRRRFAGEVRRVLERQPRARVLSIAAGHLREAELLEPDELARVAEWIAVDQDAASLAEVRRSLDVPNIATLACDLARFMRAASALGEFDLVYAAGLYDYLPDPLAVRLARCMRRLLAPGGRLLFANFAVGIEDEPFMEIYLDWSLIYRSLADMRAIVEHAAPESESAVDVGAGANVIYATIDAPRAV